MSAFTISRDKLNSFLNCFGKDLMDIVITVNRESIHAAVAKSTHYISRQVECTDGTPGNLYISDIPKMKAFLGTSKIPELQFSQQGKTGTLHIRCGNTSLQIPTTSYIESQKKVGLMTKTIDNARDSMPRARSVRTTAIANRGSARVGGAPTARAATWTGCVAHPTANARAAGAAELGRASITTRAARATPTGRRTFSGVPHKSHRYYFLLPR